VALKEYGVLSGQVIETRREGGTDSPHYQVHLLDGNGVHYRAAINVRSQQSPSELRYLVVDGFDHPVLAALPAPGSGWTPLPPRRGAANLDFIRGNLFDPAAMRTLPADVPGPDNDLADVLDLHVRRAGHDPDTVAYVFGQRWGPEPDTADKIFGFRPGNGVHDIHMNQGNSGRFTRDDGVWQDGGLLLHLNAPDRWVATFLAFQSQAWHTDDVTGHALTGSQPPPADGGRAVVRILAALVNPIGPAPERETVTLLNASPATVDLTGWTCADRSGRTCPLPAGPLAAGATTTLALTEGVTLGNRGGTVTLLDPHARKVHGVSYTAEQARHEGWTITF
jgi:uncharacterized protein YukJ